MSHYRCHAGYSAIYFQILSKGKSYKKLQCTVIYFIPLNLINYITQSYEQ